MKECSSNKVLIVKKDWPGGQQEQGHGVVLHDSVEGYQEPTTYRSGISQWDVPSPDSLLGSLYLTSLN